MVPHRYPVSCLTSLISMIPPSVPFLGKWRRSGEDDRLSIFSRLLAVKVGQVGVSVVPKRIAVCEAFDRLLGIKENRSRNQSKT